MFDTAVWWCRTRVSHRRLVVINTLQCWGPPSGGLLHKVHCFATAVWWWQTHMLDTAVWWCRPRCVSHLRLLVIDTLHIVLGTAVWWSPSQNALFCYRRLVVANTRVRHRRLVVSDPVGFAAAVWWWHAYVFHTAVW